MKPPSDLDIGLPTAPDGAVYLAALEEALAAVLASEPELLVYVAGADPYIEDQLGGLALTLDDLARRDLQGPRGGGRPRGAGGDGACRRLCAESSSTR